jgi:hypothetical protein
MATLTKRFGVAALAGAAVWLLAVTPAFGQYITPAYSFRAGQPLNQNYYNLAVLGRALSNVPPYAFGFNPVVPPLNGFPGVPPMSPFVSPVSPFTSAATLSSVSPYGAYGAGGYSSPYAASPGYSSSPGYGTGSNSYGMGGYNSSYSYADPFGGGLRGAAEAIRAQGQFEKDFQGARLLNQEVERSKLETRRKIYDEWLYERANTPTVVDIQEKTQKLENRRALLGMPLSEILSGYALNTILDDLRKRASWGGKDPYGPIDPELLRQINVTSQSSGGNVGVFKPVKEGGPLAWPLPLQAAAYQDEVRRLNQRAAEAVKLVQNAGQVDPGTLNDMKEDVRRLRSKVSAHIDDLTPSQSIEANRFLNQLDDGVKGLAQPDVASYFTDKFAAKGKTVPELVQYMAQKGLKFAPATGGDEAAYSALYNYLVGYSLQTSAAPAGKE